AESFAKMRINFQQRLRLSEAFFVAFGKPERPACDNSARERKRVKFQRATGGCYCLLAMPHGDQPKALPAMCQCIIGIERQCSRKTLFGCRKIPIREKLQ